MDQNTFNALDNLAAEGGGRGYEQSGLTAELYAALAEAYQRQWGADLYAVDSRGAIVLGENPCTGCIEEACRCARLSATRGTMRWGEATVSFCPGQRLIWAVPLTVNLEIVGGLVASLPEELAFKSAASDELRDFRQLCQALRVLAEEAKLTNTSHLELRRLQYTGEQCRAYALHAAKMTDHNSLRKLYLREEPALFAAIRSGDRPAAREILNRVLVGLHHHAAGRVDLLKSVFLELVVVMSRTAVEAGGDPEELLGTNFSSMAALAHMSTEEQIGGWLVRTLEHLLDAIERGRAHDPGVLVTAALAYIQQNCACPLHRDDVASAVGVSPSHFSYLIRKETGSTFTELLNEARTDRAADLLRQSDNSLAAISLMCGFGDQSYFTKVFKRHRKQTPLRYRKSKA
jgi:AraC-like DNA-binding protein